VDLYDYAREASKPLQPSLYAGSNDGEAILYEGTADGLKDTPKPLAFGAAGVPASVIPDRQGVWQAIPFGPPAADADAVIPAFDIVSATSDAPQSAPIGEVRVGWGRIWQTFEGAELAPDLVGEPEQERLKAEYRWAVSPDAGVKARFPDTWRTVEIRTALRLQADGQNLADRLRSLLGLKMDGRPRRAWRIVVPEQTARTFRLGMTLAITLNAELNGHYLLIGEEPLRPRSTQTTLTVWG
ncbi:MAG: hypothetical protein U1C74_14800, partial [Phenylobacterium sp.]|nr:hypothetical protein [Phenylobacterium sp.]